MYIKNILLLDMYLNLYKLLSLFILNICSYLFISFIYYVFVKYITYTIITAKTMQWHDNQVLFYPRMC